MAAPERQFCAEVRFHNMEPGGKENWVGDQKVNTGDDGNKPQPHHFFKVDV